MKLRLKAALITLGIFLGAGIFIGIINWLTDHISPLIFLISMFGILGVVGVYITYIMVYEELRRRQND